MKYPSIFSFTFVLFASSALIMLADAKLDEDELDIETYNEEPPAASAVVSGKEEEEIEDYEDQASTGSPDASIYVLFTKPRYYFEEPLEVTGNQPIELLLSLENQSKEAEFFVNQVEASLRYPMDFNFHIQNFTTLDFGKRNVSVNNSVTIAYSFSPSLVFAGRPMTLFINIGYENDYGEKFYEVVYNNTINIKEEEKSIDGEMLFLYVIMAAVFVLLLVLGHHFLYSLSKNRLGSSTMKKPIIPLETGTKKTKDVDYDWVPKQTLMMLNKSPRITKSERKSQKNNRSDTE